MVSISMGYGVSVTPLQMAVAAVSAVANGGELVEPRVRQSGRCGTACEDGAPAPGIVRRSVSGGDRGRVDRASWRPSWQSVARPGQAQMPRVYRGRKDWYRLRRALSTVRYSDMSTTSRRSSGSCRLVAPESHHSGHDRYATVRSEIHGGRGRGTRCSKRIAEAALATSCRRTYRRSEAGDPPVLVAAMPAPRVELAIERAANSSRARY